MAMKGFRIKRVKKFLYEFEECPSGQYEYRVEFVGQKSPTDSLSYRSFLEDIGYTVFYKNINLNYSIGKIRYRPWAEKGAKISTNATTFNREILIVEKERDNKPFNLHTSYEDQIAYYSSLRNPWLFVFLSTLLLAIINTSYICGSLTILALFPVIMYQAQIYNQKKELRIKEW
jgi:hypothetical protein